jgi:hypothetical protein
VERTITQTAAIGTGAIPLRKPAARSGAEDLNAHEDTGNAEVKKRKKNYGEPASESEL